MNTVRKEQIISTLLLSGRDYNIQEKFIINDIFLMHIKAKKQLYHPIARAGSGRR